MKTYAPSVSISTSLVISPKRHTSLSGDILDSTPSKTDPRKVKRMQKLLLYGWQRAELYDLGLANQETTATSLYSDTKA